MRPAAGPRARHLRSPAKRRTVRDAMAIQPATERKPTSNQYIKAAELGLPPPGLTTGFPAYQPPHTGRAKDKIRAEHLCNRLSAFAADEPDEHGRIVVMSPAQILAARIVIDKGKPSLQSVSFEENNPLEGQSEEDLLTSIRAILAARPELIRALRPCLVQSGDSGHSQAPSAAEGLLGSVDGIVERDMGSIDHYRPTASEGICPSEPDRHPDSAPVTR